MTNAEFSEQNDLTEDAFMGYALRVFQPRIGYRAGIDAVLAAAAVPLGNLAKSNVLDAGAGAGVVGLCIASRSPTAHVTMVEIDPTLATLARRNIGHNNFSQRVNVVEHDIGVGGAAFDPTTGHPDLLPGSYDHVVSNPPFYFEGRGTPSPRASKARAHAMAAADLDAWVRFLAAGCKTGGTITVINRTDVLPDLINSMRIRFGALRILPLHARESEPAGRFIIQGIKGSRAPLTLLAGLILHDESQSYRPNIEAILRTGQALPLS